MGHTSFCGLSVLNCAASEHLVRAALDRIHDGRTRIVDVGTGSETQATGSGCLTVSASRRDLLGGLIHEYERAA